MKNIDDFFNSPEYKLIQEQMKSFTNPSSKIFEKLPKGYDFIGGTFKSYNETMRALPLKNNNSVLEKSVKELVTGLEKSQFYNRKNKIYETNFAALLNKRQTNDFFKFAKEIDLSKVQKSIKDIVDYMIFMSKFNWVIPMQAEIEKEDYKTAYDLNNQQDIDRFMMNKFSKNDFEILNDYFDYIYSFFNSNENSEYKGFAKLFMNIKNIFNENHNSFIVLISDLFIIMEFLFGETQPFKNKAKHDSKLYVKRKYFSDEYSRMKLNINKVNESDISFMDINCYLCLMKVSESYYSHFASKDANENKFGRNSLFHGAFNPGKMTIIMFCKLVCICCGIIDEIKRYE